MKFTFPTNETPEKILQGIGPLRNTWEYRAASIATLIQLIIGALTLLIFWRHLPPKVPLWYSMPWGEDRLTSPWMLFLPILVSLVVYAGNIIAVVRLSADHPMFARVLFLTSLLVSILSLILVIRVVTLVN